MTKKQNSKPAITPKTPSFPPVVAVLGHVDHGKTTLLDAIAKTNVAQREHGGITQKIGASNIEITHDGVKRHITFIDTPGHQTFAAMRTRGAKVADVGLLVVSSVDGVMPQTKESIKLFLISKIPFIVVVTKTDLPEKNVEKVKQQLVKEDVMLEGLGGDVPVIEVSAKTNKNITELLELILLVFDMHQNLFKDRSTEEIFEGIVIESKLDPRVGPKATVVVKNGTISIRDIIIADGIEGKVRALIGANLKQVDKATIGDAVEVLGFMGVPAVGSIVSVQGGNDVRAASNPPASATLNIMHHDTNALSIIIVADTLGSLEAIVSALPKEIVVMLQKTGEVASSDILLAKSTKSIIIGFNIAIKPDIAQMARTEKVPIKNYTIIYELLDELKDVVEGKALALQEEILGGGKVLASFPFEKTKVLGVGVLEGRIARGDKVRLTRGETVVGEGTISSIRQGKNVVSKVEKGQEAGVIVSPLLDFTIGDMLISHR